MRTTAFGQPPPAIESISPTIVMEGSPALTVTIKGAGFTRRSQVSFDGKPVVFRRVSDTELKATIDAGLLAGARTFAITETCRESLQRTQWGLPDNRLYMLVTFEL